MKSPRPGLIKDLKPNEDLKLRGTPYVVRNLGLYPIRIRVYVDPNQQVPSRPEKQS